MTLAEMTENELDHVVVFNLKGNRRLVLRLENYQELNGVKVR